jgi:hypothetical protein
MGWEDVHEWWIGKYLVAGCHDLFYGSILAFTWTDRKVARNLVQYIQQIEFWNGIPEYKSEVLPLYHPSWYSSTTCHLIYQDIQWSHFSEYEGVSKSYQTES